MRLHPAKDGLLPLPDERGLTVRDRAGNPLRDVVSQKTGYCTGVTSALTPTGQTVIPLKAPSTATGPDVRYDAGSARFYDMVRNAPDAPVGLVIRLVSDGDDRLPCTRVRVVEMPRTESGASERKSTAPVRKSDSARKMNDQAVRAVLTAMGYTGPITRELRKATLEMIEMEKAVSGRSVG